MLLKTKVWDVSFIDEDIQKIINNELNIFQKTKKLINETFDKEEQFLWNDKERKDAFKWAKNTVLNQISINNNSLS